jgi:hypothetical protein
LSGRLDYVLYPGPPNYSDVQKGDTPEPNYVLRLPRPICISGDDFADPKTYFDRVQVVASGPELAQLKRLLHRVVTLHLRDPMAAETGHHHEPLVAWVTRVDLAAQPLDFIDEYGTAATTIRAFYEALADGQGAAASQMIVPEKRSLEAFSPQGLSSFYGRLTRPLRLLGISRIDNSNYAVHYQYSAKRVNCDGHAIVVTIVRGGRNFIQSIRALNGC